MFLTLAVLIAVALLLILDRWRASAVFAVGALVLLLAGELESTKFLNAFTNPSIVSIFLLVIITAVVNEHFDLVKLLDKWFSRSTRPRSFLLKMGISVGSLSAVMNNTPIVALMIPYVYQWGKKHGISPSRLLIPLSYSTILGGMITVIGTSTNLVLNGFLESSGHSVLEFGDYLIPGVLVTLVGVLFISLVGYRFLPENKDIIEEATGSLKEYLVETEVSDRSPLIGKTVEEAELRNLDGIFLVEILREDRAISPVTPERIIQANDRLFFAGDTDKVINLVHENNGLQLPKQEKYSLGRGVQVIETVVPPNSTLIGRTLKEVEFRDKFNAAVLAIHRNGEKIRGKLGEIKLDKGDLLLISAGNGFKRKVQEGKDLYLVSVLRTIKETDRNKAWTFGLASLVSIALCIAGIYPLFVALLLILGMAALLGFTNYSHIKKHVSLDLLIILGSAIAIGHALIDSGASVWLGHHVQSWLHGLSPQLVLVSLFLCTALFTSFITNAAAVAILFPVAFSLSSSFEISHIAIFLTLAFGASCSFITPIGYQTNLMIYGPGNYRFKDFIRLGLPLSLIYAVISLGWIFYRYL